LQLSEEVEPLAFWRGNVDQERIKRNSPHEHHCISGFLCFGDLMTSRPQDCRGPIRQVRLATDDQQASHGDYLIGI
jgi:hypothetical protein